MKFVNIYDLLKIRFLDLGTQIMQSRGNMSVSNYQKFGSINNAGEALSDVVLSGDRVDVDFNDVSFYMSSSSRTFVNFEELMVPDIRLPVAAPKGDYHYMLHENNSGFMTWQLIKIPGRNFRLDHALDVACSFSKEEPLVVLFTKTDELRSLLFDRSGNLVFREGMCEFNATIGMLCGKIDHVDDRVIATMVNELLEMNPIIRAYFFSTHSVINKIIGFYPHILEEALCKLYNIYLSKINELLGQNHLLLENAAKEMMMRGEAVPVSEDEVVLASVISSIVKTLTLIEMQGRVDMQHSVFSLIEFFKVKKFNASRALFYIYFRMLGQVPHNSWNTEVAKKVVGLAKRYSVEGILVASLLMVSRNAYQVVYAHYDTFCFHLESELILPIIEDEAVVVEAKLNSLEYAGDETPLLRYLGFAAGFGAHKCVEALKKMSHENPPAKYVFNGVRFKLPYLHLSSEDAIREYARELRGILTTHFGATADDLRELVIYFCIPVLTNAVLMV